MEYADFGYNGGAPDEDSTGYGYNGMYDGAMGGIRGMRGMGGFNYAPYLGPVGQGDSYDPGETRQDAQALHYLGFMDPDVLTDHLGDWGSSGDIAFDMANKTGAFHPEFQDAVQRFQQAVGIEADGWIGPQTRGALLAAVTAKNAQEMPNPLPIPPPPHPPIDPPGPLPPGPLPGPQPVVDKQNNTLKYVGIGVGALALLGLGYWALSD